METESSQIAWPCFLVPISAVTPGSRRPGRTAPRVAGSRSSGLACDLELAGDLPSSLRGTGRRHPLRPAAAWLMPLLGAGQVSATG